MKSQSNKRTIAALGIRLGNLKSYSARDFCLGSRALRSRRSRARCSRAARSSPNRIARTSKKELPLRAASSSTSRYDLAISGSFSSARSRSSRAWRLSSRRAILVLVGGVTETVVNSRIGRLQLDVVDQLAPLRSRQSGRGKLPAPAFRQQKVLDVGGVVGRKFQGPGDGRKHFDRAVDSRQTKQATQVDAGLHRLAFQAKVELACLGPQGIKRLFQ